MRNRIRGRGEVLSGGGRNLARVRITAFELRRTKQKQSVIRIGFSQCQLSRRDTTRRVSEAEFCGEGGANS